MSYGKGARQASGWLFYLPKKGKIQITQTLHPQPNERYDKIPPMLLCSYPPSPSREKPKQNPSWKKTQEKRKKEGSTEFTHATHTHDIHFYMRSGKDSLSLWSLPGHLLEIHTRSAVGELIRLQMKTKKTKKNPPPAPFFPAEVGTDGRIAGFF